MFAIWLIITLSVIGYSFASKQYGCPDKLEIAPCTCGSMGSGAFYLDCKRIDDVEVYKTVFSYCQRYTFNSVYIKFAVFHVLPTSIFEDIEIENLYIEDVTAVSLFDAPLPETLQVKTIFMQSTKLMRGMIWENFKNLKVNKLDVFDINLKSIGPDFTDNIDPVLNWLHLGRCNLRVLKSGALQKYTKLNKIAMPSNKLTKLQRDYLPIPYNGQYLDFNSNKLTNLPYDIFTQMTELKWIDFSYNKLSVIPAMTVNPRTIWLYGLNDNPIRCDCRLYFLITAKPQRLLGKCKEPKSLEGRKIAGLNPSDFSC